MAMLFSASVADSNENYCAER